MPVPTLAPGTTTRILSSQITGTTPCSDSRMMWEIWDYVTNSSLVSDLNPGTSGYGLTSGGGGDEIWTLPANAPQGGAPTDGSGRFGLRVSPDWVLANP